MNNHAEQMNSSESDDAFAPPESEIASQLQEQDQPDLREKNADTESQEVVENGREREEMHIEDPLVVLPPMGEVIAEVFKKMLDEDEAARREADALLGGCPDQVCTYPEGYKSRQPLYSCKTCLLENGGQYAGICYGCAENCHQGHELIELYTKRLFCCDCGNKKFAQKCQLYENKDELNLRNKYNDNFKGIYCVCKQPYPPPEHVDGEKQDEADCAEDEEEEMVTCCVCEDWFHPTHIFSATNVPVFGEEHQDLVCRPCVQKMPWLKIYHQQKEAEKNANEEIQTTECKLAKMRAIKDQNDQKGNGGASSTDETALCFWPEWRDMLCRCAECMALYEDGDCSFLLDPEDTMEFYDRQNRELMDQQQEEKQKRKPKDSALWEREMTLKICNEVEQMRQHCDEFFTKRGSEKRSLNKEDVIECFEELNAKRRRIAAERDEPREAAWTQ